MATDTFVKDLEIDGTPYKIYVGANGKFFSPVDGSRELSADTLKALTEKLRKQRRQSRLSIPVTLVDVPSWRDDEAQVTIRRGVLTGIHAGNDRLLFKGDDGESDTLGSYDGAVCRRLTDEDVAALQKVWQDKIEAEARWEAAQKALQVNGRELVRQAANLPPDGHEDTDPR